MNASKLSLIENGTKWTDERVMRVDGLTIFFSWITDVVNLTIVVYISIVVVVATFARERVIDVRTNA